MSKEYDEYLEKHKSNVQRGYIWLRTNLPKLFDKYPDVNSSILTHDQSKSEKDEYEAYDAYFYGEKTPAVEEAFRRAWLLHIHRNPHHCPGCHNPSTHSFNGGKVVAIHDILTDIEKNKNYIDGITLSGGEPFCQIDQCSIIAKKAQELGLTVWCYTGFSFEELYGRGDALELLQNLDVLVDGPFILEERSLDLDFRGSRNQRIIDVRTSLKEGMTIMKKI